MDMHPKKSVLESFVLDERVAELEVVDDLWYFVVGASGAVIVGSGRG